MVQVYVTRIEELQKENYAILYEGVSDYRRQKMDRLRRPEDKIRSLVAGALFEYGLRQYFFHRGNEADGQAGISDSAEKAFERIQEKRNESVCLGPMGKPYIEGLEFNLSHAGIYVAAAFGLKSVGIDVEGGREPSEKIVAKFHPEERSWYESGENVNNKNRSQGDDMAAAETTIPKESSYRQRDRFYRLWTAKESVMKRDGRGFTMGLDSFSVFSHQLKREIYSVPLDENYWLSLCSSEGWNEKIHWITIENLLGVNED